MPKIIPIGSVEDIRNKVTSIDGEVNDEQYPSAKAVKEAIYNVVEDIENAAFTQKLCNFIGITLTNVADNSNNPTIMLVDGSEYTAVYGDTVLYSPTGYHDDVNNDGFVDDYDRALVNKAVSSSDKNTLYDINRDGVVDVIDLTSIRGQVDLNEYYRWNNSEWEIYYLITDKIYNPNSLNAQSGKAVAEALSLLDGSNGKNFANAVKGAAQGQTVVLDDISPIEHELEVKVSAPPNIEEVQTSIPVDISQLKKDNGKPVGVNEINIIGGANQFPIITTLKEMSGGSLSEGNDIIIKFKCNGNPNLGATATLYNGTFDEWAEGGSVKPLTEFDAPSKDGWTEGISNTIKVNQEVLNGWLLFSVSADDLDLANMRVYDLEIIKIDYTKITLTANDKTYTPQPDGTVLGVKSEYPTLTLSTNSEEATISCVYNRDTNKALDNPIADYVVEQGTSGNWYYEKWNSGKAVCWCNFTCNLTKLSVDSNNTGYGIVEGGGNIYGQGVPFPTGLFNSVPTIDYSVANDNGQGVGITSATLHPVREIQSKTHTGCLYVEIPSIYGVENWATKNETSGYWEFKNQNYVPMNISLSAKGSWK